MYYDLAYYVEYNTITLICSINYTRQIGCGNYTIIDCYGAKSDSSYLCTFQISSEAYHTGAVERIDGEDFPNYGSQYLKKYQATWVPSNVLKTNSSLANRVDCTSYLQKLLGDYTGEYPSAKPGYFNNYVQTTTTKNTNDTTLKIKYNFSWREYRKVLGSETKNVVHTENLEIASFNMQTLPPWVVSTTLSSGNLPSGFSDNGWVLDSSINGNRPHLKHFYWSDNVVMPSK